MRVLFANYRIRHAKKTNLIKFCNFYWKCQTKWIAGCQTCTKLMSQIQGIEPMAISLSMPLRIFFKDVQLKY